MRRLLIVFFCAATSAFGSAMLVTDPTVLDTTDFASWSTGTSGPNFSAWSTDNEYVTAHLSNGSGMVVPACMGTCGFQPTSGGEIAANDALLLTGTGKTSAQPVSVSISDPVYGLGAYIEDANNTNGDAATQFWVNIQAFAGTNSVLNIATQSDAAGDPLFVGVSDLAQEITKVIYTLTDGSGNVVTGNFVLDKVYIQDSLIIIPPAQPATGTPEPGASYLMGSGLLALAFGIRKRSVRAKS